MRVLLVWPNFDADNAAGVRARAFARAWREAGVDVCVITHTSGQPRHETWEGVAVHRIRAFHGPEDAKGFWRSDRAMLSAVREAKPDVAVVSSPSVLFAWQGARAVRALGIPWALDVRDFSTENLRAMNGSRLRYLLLGRMERKCMTWAPRVLHVTRLMGDELVERYGVDRSWLYYAPNGHDFPTGDVKARAVAEVVHLGTLNDESRRPFEVLEAFAGVRASRPSTTFAFIGWDPRGPLAQRIEAEAARLGLTDALRLVPRVDHAQVPALLAGAKAGIVPTSDHASYRAAVGAKTYEYLAAGLPLAVLGQRRPGSELQRLVEEHDCGIFASDAPALAAGLLRILQEPEAYATWSRNAREASRAYERGPVARRVLDEVLRPLTGSQAASA